MAAAATSAPEGAVGTRWAATPAPPPCLPCPVEAQRLWLGELSLLMGGLPIRCSSLSPDAAGQSLGAPAGSRPGEMSRLAATLRVQGTHGRVLPPPWECHCRTHPPWELLRESAPGHSRIPPGFCYGLGPEPVFPDHSRIPPGFCPGLGPEPGFPGHSRTPTGFVPGPVPGHCPAPGLPDHS